MLSPQKYNSKGEEMSEANVTLRRMTGGMKKNFQR